MNASDESLKCEMCDTLGIAGPCRTHKDDPFAGVVDGADSGPVRGRSDDWLDGPISQREIDAVLRQFSKKNSAVRKEY